MAGKNRKSNKIKVISKCEGLPLALKVIGASLASRADNIHVWRVTRDKLRQAKPLGDEYQNELLGCIRSSVDALEPNLRDCFMDLGAFPEDTWSPIDNLLDIWVYVRGMTWDYAYYALIELQSRCLVNLKDDEVEVKIQIQIVTSISTFAASFPSNMMDYGCGGSLVFSQHDVLKDLAIQLGCEDQQQRWLLMSRRQQNILQEWKSTRSLANVAQVISINAGTMIKEDWPSLRFPLAEVLLLYCSDGEVSKLPSFVKNMSKLKVLVIRYSTIGGLVVSFEGLHYLQSLYIDAQTLRIVDRHWWSRLLSMPKLKKILVITHAYASRYTKYSILNSHMLEKMSSSLEILILEEPFSSNALEIPIMMKHLFKNLKVLHIEGHNQLPTYIWEIKTLEVLQICDCYELEEILNNIGEIQNLKRLTLIECGRLKNLPLSIAKLSCLKELVLQDAWSLCALPDDIIIMLRHLETLELMDCNFPLPPNIGKLQSLKTLRLAGFLEVKVLPESLVNLGHLEILELRCFYSLTELPLGIGHLACLRELILHMTPKLVGLPESLLKLSSLKALILIDCESLTSLPLSIEKLPCLKRISQY